MSPAGSAIDPPFVTHGRGDRAVSLFKYKGRGVSVWTDVVDDRRVCVGVEIQPMSDAWKRRTLRRAQRWTMEKIENSDADPTPEPITRDWLRGVPLGTLLAEGAKVARQAAEAPVGASEDGVPIDVEPPPEALHQARLIERTMDAVAYVARVRAGSRSPAKDLAEQWGCSIPTARARIAEARTLGLLSSAGAGAVGGSLQNAAVEILHQTYSHFPTEPVWELAKAAGVQLDHEREMEKRYGSS